MKPDVKAQCEQAFQRTLRSQPHELDPESSLYEIAKLFFTAGFSEGGKLAAEMVSSGIHEDIQRIFDGNQS